MNLLLCTQSSGPDHRVDPDKHRRASFLFPESTQEFEQLPLEFRVSVRLLNTKVCILGSMHYARTCTSFNSGLLWIYFHCP